MTFDDMHYKNSQRYLFLRNEFYGYTAPDGTRYVGDDLDKYIDDQKDREARIFLEAGNKALEERRRKEGLRGK